MENEKVFYGSLIVIGMFILAIGAMLSMTNPEYQHSKMVSECVDSFDGDKECIETCSLLKLR